MKIQVITQGAQRDLRAQGVGKYRRVIEGVKPHDVGFISEDSCGTPPGFELGVRTLTEQRAVRMVDECATKNHKLSFKSTQIKAQRIADLSPDNVILNSDYSELYTKEV